MPVQSVLVPRRMGKERAKRWVREHGFRAGKVHTTKRYYRFRQTDPKGYKRFRAKTIDGGGVILILGWKDRKKKRKRKR